MPLQANESVPSRLLPVGAEVSSEGTHFRVWAPACQRVAVALPGGALELTRGDAGYYEGFAKGVRAGTLYRFRLDSDERLYPDPASRFQPEGPHGSSMVIDARTFRWTDSNWQGVGLQGQVLYELHPGTFTPEGTWEAAARQLPHLADLGVTILEVMPVADFPGKFGWGYDGVNLFAPCRLYGTPDDFRAFIDRAHALGLGVILDVVYNHFGPDGNYLSRFADSWFTDKHKGEWGDPINFDGKDSMPVREFFLANARHWISEYHLDGLRLDATQAILDDSPEHILAVLARTVREAGGRRSTYLVAENEPQDSRLVRPVSEGGYGLDSLWNDDFHHSAMVALTGRNEAYYTDYFGTPQEFISAAKWGFLYQGQRYKWQKKRRGVASLDIEPARFVTFLQNHDQVANSGRGLRCHALTSPGRFRALSALLLLGPGTPLLFQGQEFASSAPFFYFADHTPELAALVRKGRLEFLSQFRSLAEPHQQDGVPSPHDPRTFERCKLDFRERETHRETYDLYRDLLRLRRETKVLRTPRRRSLDGAVLGRDAFVLRFFAESDRSEERLLIVNLGRDCHLDPAPEPLLAPPAGCLWETVWSSESLQYGGDGVYPLDTEENWRLPGEAAVLLAPIRA